MRIIKKIKKKKDEISAEEKLFIASQWKLMWWKFKKHQLAILGATILAIFYILAIFCEFFSPYHIHSFIGYPYSPPQRIHFFDGKRFYLRPFVYELKREIHPITRSARYSEDKTKKYPIYFFVRGDMYEFWNLFYTDIHLFGVKEPGVISLFGTDKMAQDLFSRNLYASRISLSIGLVGVGLSFLLGITLGGVSGYYGGKTDMVVQRVVELLICIPTIPLWLALSAALPVDWSPIKIYFGITIILSIVGWCALARVVRGKLMSLKEEDFIMAAKIAGATDGRIIIRHLLPSFLSYLIVSITLTIPAMILGETALSFLGLGIRSPAVSWGTLLYDAQNIRILSINPWLLIPGLFVIIVVLAFNFLGDGLRDAADPYK